MFNLTTTVPPHTHTLLLTPTLSSSHPHPPPHNYTHFLTPSIPIILPHQTLPHYIHPSITLSLNTLFNHMVGSPDTLITPPNSQARQLGERIIDVLRLLYMYTALGRTFETCKATSQKQYMLPMDLADHAEYDRKYVIGQLGESLESGSLYVNVFTGAGF